MSKPPLKHYHIFFSGHVQGVGFRYTAHRYASERDVTGWVKNLPDGRVEMRVEGPGDQIESFIENVRRHFDGSIRDIQQDVSAFQGQFRGFDIH